MLDDLPVELLLRLAAYLNGIDVVVLSLVSSRLQRIILAHRVDLPPIPTLNIFWADSSIRLVTRTLRLTREGCIDYSKTLNIVIRSPHEPCSFRDASLYSWNRTSLHLARGIRTVNQQTSSRGLVWFCRTERPAINAVCDLVGHPRFYSKKLHELWILNMSTDAVKQVMPRLPDVSPCLAFDANFMSVYGNRLPAYRRREMIDNDVLLQLIHKLAPRDLRILANVTTKPLPDKFFENEIVRRLKTLQIKDGLSFLTDDLLLGLKRIGEIKLSGYSMVTWTGMRNFISKHVKSNKNPDLHVELPVETTKEAAQQAMLIIQQRHNDKEVDFNIEHEGTSLVLTVQGRLLNDEEL